jgi:hypothetical protein
MFENSQHLAFYPVRTPQIARMLQNEAGDSEPGGLDCPRERLLGLLLLQLKPYRIKDGLYELRVFLAVFRRVISHSQR